MVLAIDSRRSKASFLLLMIFNLVFSLFFCFFYFRVPLQGIFPTHFKSAVGFIETWVVCVLSDHILLVTHFIPYLFGFQRFPLVKKASSSYLFLLSPNRVLANLIYYALFEVCLRFAKKGTLWWNSRCYKIEKHTSCINYDRILRLKYRWGWNGILYTLHGSFSLLWSLFL